MNNNFPLVSVIVITYQSSRFVLEALESVKAQTWKNIELIVSDDGSNDNTIELCTQWIEQNHERFFATKIITVANNTGIPANCNRGLNAANGNWLKLIAGDDVLLNNCIEDNMVYSSLFPEASFIVSDMQEIDDDSIIINSRVKNQGLIFFTKIKSTKEQLKAYARWPSFLNTPTFFFTKELIETINYFDEEFRIYEDMSMIYNILNKGIEIYYLDKITVKYRIHEKATSRTSKIDDLRGKEALQIFKKYRQQRLNKFNPLDLSVYYENWLAFVYKGFNGYKGISVLQKLSLLHWYLRFYGLRRN